MRWIAWKMLTGDRAKYLGTVFGVAFGVLLIAQQTSIFVGIIGRTASQIVDVREPDFWVMDPYTQNADDIKPLAASDLYRVRGVEGVEWAVPLFKGQVRARTSTGHFWQSILIGVDDQSLVGAPPKMLQGDVADLRRPDAVIVDEIGYRLLWPEGQIELGRELEMNDRRAVVVGICDVSSPFFTFPVMFTRYSLAMGYVPPQRRQMSFVVGRVSKGFDQEEVLADISEQTKLVAYDDDQFFWTIIGYYLRNTGIPVNFGITIALGFIVGAAIAGQTFYLFTLENLKQFGALKAMGLANPRLVGMVLLQAAIVGIVGYCLGIGMTAAFFEFTADLNPNLRGLYLLPQIALGAAATVVVIVIIASVMSLRKVLVLEPAVVFRG
ncbi:MAG: ABC transporter permease [Planctomycetales bacterium]|nr:ABC transporter permease [Planctomycetales bacterium]